MEAVFCVQGGAQPVGFVFLKHNNKLARLLQLCPLPTEHSSAVNGRDFPCSRSQSWEN